MSNRSKFVNIIYAIIFYSGIYSIIGIMSFNIVIQELEGFGRVNIAYYVFIFFCAILMIVNYTLRDNDIRSPASYVILLIFMIPLVLIASLSLLGTFKILPKLF